MKTITISGSSSLQAELKTWVQYFEKRNYKVIARPKKLKNVRKEYAKTFADFFDSIDKTNTLFIMNADKNGIRGYIGPATFAEFCYAISRNQRGLSDTEIILQQLPSSTQPCFQEVALWLEQGWVKLVEDTV